MSVRRQGEARTDLSTPVGATRKEAVKAVYGAAVAKHLLPLQLSVGGWVDDEAGDTSMKDDGLRCRVEVSGVLHSCSGWHI
jgi:hypothetical protein